MRGGRGEASREAVRMKEGNVHAPLRLCSHVCAEGLGLGVLREQAERPSERSNLNHFRFFPPSLHPLLFFSFTLSHLFTLHINHSFTRYSLAHYHSSFTRSITHSTTRSLTHALTHYCTPSSIHLCVPCSAGEQCASARDRCAGATLGVCEVRRVRVCKDTGV